MKLQDEELKGCTFKPEINSKDKIKTKKDDSSFYERNEKWKKDKENKMKQSEPEHPHTHGDKSYNEGHIDRLYKDYMTRQTKINQLSQKVLKELGVSFSPKINKGMLRQGQVTITNPLLSPSASHLPNGNGALYRKVGSPGNSSRFNSLKKRFRTLNESEFIS